MPDFPPDDDICGALEERVRRSLDHLVVEFDPDGVGPLEDEGNPHFRVLSCVKALFVSVALLLGH